MGGDDTVGAPLFSYVNLEKRVRADHPLRVIRGVVKATLVELSLVFDALYAPHGRESIPPERLLRAPCRRPNSVCLSARLTLPRPAPAIAK